jgi:nicotinate-nucleotide--dimethylbenzimidazole phosphoribosyltransferase
MGVAADLSHLPDVADRKVRAGTADLSRGPAMTRAEARAALDAGAAVAQELVVDGARLLVTGDVGIGNTTPSAALIAVLAGAPAAAVTGPGAGADGAVLATKRAVVAAAAARARSHDDPLDVVADVGGLELAALAGFVVGGAAAGVPVVVDGVIALAGALAAEALVPTAGSRCVAGHRSPEPGASVALDRLGLVPLLDLGLRLGEGTGACLAVPLVQAAARVLAEMATLDSLLGGGRGGPAGNPV